MSNEEFGHGTVSLVQGLIQAEKEAREAEVRRVEAKMDDALARVEKKVDKLVEVIDPVVTLSQAVTPIAKFLRNRWSLVWAALLLTIVNWVGTNAARIAAWLF